MSESNVHDGPVQGGAVATRNAAPGTVRVPNAGGPPMEIPTDLSPAALIYIALQTGQSPDALEKLVGLQERMERRQAEKDFIDSLAQFRAACPPIKKNKTANIKTDGGGSYSYTYAELDEIAATVDPILERFGFSYTWNTTATKEAVTVECILLHRAGHTRSSTFTVPVESKSGMSPQQKYGAASTFAQRRSLGNVLGLTTTDKDNDTAAVDPTKISEDQATELSDMVRDICRGDQEKRFLAYMGVGSVAAIRLADYKKAKASLARVREANEKADAKKAGGE